MSSIRTLGTIASYCNTMIIVAVVHYSVANIAIYIHCSYIITHEINKISMLMLMQFQQVASLAIATYFPILG